MNNPGDWYRSFLIWLHIHIPTVSSNQISELRVMCSWAAVSWTKIYPLMTPNIAEPGADLSDNNQAQDVSTGSETYMVTQFTSAK